MLYYRAMKYEKIKISEKDISSEGIVQLITKLQKAAQKKPNLLLDFKGVDIVNSGSIGVLIRQHKDLQLGNGGIALLNISETLETILDNSGLNRIIPVFKKLADYEESLIG